MVAFLVYLNCLIAGTFCLFMFGCSLPIGKDRNKMAHLSLIGVALFVHLGFGFSFGAIDQEHIMNKDLIEKGLKHYVTDSKTGETKLIWTNPEFNIEKSKGE